MDEPLDTTRMPEPQNVSQWQAVGFVTELLIAIAVPTTLLALGGRWVDEKYGTAPWATLAGLIVSLAISFVLVKRRVKSMAARLSTKR